MTDPTTPDDRHQQAYVDRMAAHIIESVRAFDSGADHETILAALRAAKFTLIPRAVWFTPKVEVVEEPPKLQLVFELFDDKGGKPRWRARSAANGQIVFTSGESFDSRSNAKAAATREAGRYPAGVAEVRET